MTNSAGKAVDVMVGAIENVGEAAKIGSSSAIQTPAEIGAITSKALSGGTEVLVETKDDAVDLLVQKARDIGDALKALLGA